MIMCYDSTLVRNLEIDPMFGSTKIACAVFVPSIHSVKCQKALLLDFHSIESKLYLNPNYPELGNAELNACCTCSKVLRYRGGRGVLSSY